MNPDLLKQCLGEPPDTLDVLVLTSELGDQPGRWLQQAYPSCSGEPEIHEITQVVDASVLKQRRWPLVCILQLCEAGCADKKAFMRLLARLRDLHADRVVHVESGCQNPRPDDPTHDYQRWTLADSLSLGYSRRGVVTNGSEQLHIFEFDIYTYKPAPDWLNARHWANPERWGKQRW